MSIWFKEYKIEDIQIPPVGIDELLEIHIPFSTRTYLENISQREKKILLIWLQIYEKLN